MRALVTGGAGFIGSHLCEALLNRGDMVYVLDDLSTGNYENIAHLEGRLTCVVDTTLNQETVRELVRQVDVVYHLAASVGVHLVVSQPTRTLINNIKGTETVLEEACRYRRRLLITSTSEVYGKGVQAVFREGDDRVIGPTNRPRWGYAASKAVDEYLALAFWREKGHPVVITRLFNTVGPRQTGRYGMVIPTFVRQALKNEPITVYGDGHQTRCFAYVGDIIPALMTLMDRTELTGEVYNIGSDESVSIEELAHRVIQRTASKSKVVYVPYEEAYGPGYDDMLHRRPSLEKIHDAIGYTPSTTLDQILDAVIENMRERLDRA